MPAFSSREPPRADEDRAAVDALRLPREVAAAGGQVAVGAAIDQRDRALALVELRDALRELLALRDHPPGPPPPARDCAGTGVVIASAMSSSFMRSTMRPSSMRTARAGCVRTILPCSLPLYLSKSAALAIGARTTSACTVPFVLGVQDFGQADDRHHLRLDHVRVEAHELPSLAERPRLLVHAGSPHSPNFFFVQSAA